jgi:hypothetical protein
MRSFDREVARAVVAASLLSLAACPNKKDASQDIVKPADSSSVAAVASGSNDVASPTPSASIAPTEPSTKPVLDALGNCTLGGSSSSMGLGGFGGLGAYGGLGSPGSVGSSSSGGGEGIGLGSVGGIGHGSGTGSAGGGTGIGFGSGGAPPVIAGTIFDAAGALAAPIQGKVVCDGLDAIRTCFEAASPTSPTFRARATVAVAVNAGGETSKVDVKTPTGDATLDACLLAAMQKLTFPSAAATSTFGYGFAYTRKPKPLKMISPEPDVKGKLPVEVVRRIVRQNFPRLRACYQAFLAKSPGATGSLSVKFEIDATGAVTSATPGSGTLTDPALLACTVGVFKALSFPEPESGKVEVTFPIEYAFD